MTWKTLMPWHEPRPDGLGCGTAVAAAVSAAILLLVAVGWLA